MFISHVKKGQLFFLATFAAMIVAGTCLLSVPLWTPQDNYPFTGTENTEINITANLLPYGHISLLLSIQRRKMRSVFLLFPTTVFLGIFLKCDPLI